ncbi:phosphoribosylaminoimidazolesuccinocarboxamide synthase [bacterium]|nr:phosphoribosylaminoimidazolesuccinocarboxamide synthase [bacterium]
MNTLHTLELPIPKLSSGKVREIFDVGDGFILVVTTDRLSAFDVILDDPIPSKGFVLNQMSLFWYNRFRGLVPNTVLMSDPGMMGLGEEIPEDQVAQLHGRSVLMKRADVIPIECIVRGYLAGSGYKDYMREGTVGGHKLPAGLKKADQLPNAIFTPSTKATEGHDENITVAQAANLVGEEITKKLEKLSLKIYTEAAKYALERGIIIADTKFEFGILDDEIVLIDEVLTPDSSRFWQADKVVPGEEPASYDKQIVRNWLEASGWDKTPPAPKLPQDILDKTSNAYQEIFSKITENELIT